MNTKRLTLNDPLSVGDKVVRLGWEIEEDAVRTVVAIVADGHGGNCYVLSPCPRFRDPCLILRREMHDWFLVLPEPRKIRGKAWVHRDGFVRAYSPGSAANLYNTIDGYVLVEFEGTEVQP